MLYHFLHPSAQTTSQPVEGTHQIPGLNPYHQRGLPAAFRLPDDGSKPDDKENEQQEAQQSINNAQHLPEGMPEMFRLVLNSDFREMFEFFMTPGHDEIIHMRNNIRHQKGLSEQTLFRPDIMNLASHDIDDIRNKTYFFTHYFFHSPLGTHFKAVI
ncbi:hypothetical protein [Natronogracilivirga saccharolytica]|uniref:Uncharacterized protein n=1 Tax=Natronogracilivirga saccharolytica TaxID=2812953 RepID=A0A8J7RQC9_9BACT|nr:hypothetical protein [Natronogracilivirga saccharolytica]MBP3191984.1 hypothetical protein [Natronogracilivirga saccharolytica]